MSTQTKINASPTKSFFVSMLTRDIDLDDAILDLLDNSLDGLLRAIPKDNENPKPYEDFFVNIKITDSKFEIEDNCGGIPTEIAKEYAFRMGRPTDRQDEDIPTIGMYGIGMKRAMFKMGTDIEVKTNNADNHHYFVKISNEWLRNDEWELTLEDLDQAPFEYKGTHIIITDLYPGIKSRFHVDSGFLSELKEKISSHYSNLIKKGFKITLNNTTIEAKRFEFILSDAIKPYVYTDRIDDVDIEIIVGLSQQAPSLEKDDEEAEKKVSKQSNAGWTIICNDRVVLFADRSRLTGWGSELPNFHYQYNSLIGIVIFNSNIAYKLPVTTTKRGIDASSDLFLRIKKRMIEGMRLYIDYTNKWKNIREQEKEIVIKQTKTSNLETIRDNVLTYTMNKVRDSENSKQFKPTLPMPPKETPSTLNISFRRDRKEIEEVSKFLFDGTILSPSTVGETCFENILTEAKK